MKDFGLYKKKDEYFLILGYSDKVRANLWFDRAKRVVLFKQQLDYAKEFNYKIVALRLTNIKNIKREIQKCDIVIDTYDFFENMTFVKKINKNLYQVEFLKMQMLGVLPNIVSIEETKRSIDKECYLYVEDCLKRLNEIPLQSYVRDESSQIDTYLGLTSDGIVAVLEHSGNVSVMLIDEFLRDYEPLYTCNFSVAINKKYLDVDEFVRLWKI